MDMNKKEMKMMQNDIHNEKQIRFKREENKFETIENCCRKETKSRKNDLKER